MTSYSRYRIEETRKKGKHMKIGVILGSVRKGRLGERVAHLVMNRLAAQEGVEAELLDLSEYPMPFYNEALNPFQITGPYEDEVANRWAAKIKETEAFVIVTPEYNHGYSAVLKNALDYLYSQWYDKPVLFVSYSNGIIGGARVVEQLRQVVSHLKLVALQEALHISKANEVLTETGEVTTGPIATILDKQLTQLVKWSKVLHTKREEA
jgi:NAD(P)H-dependent FMN reductase